MTWNYEIANDNSSMDVYDHNGNLITTVQNDGSGFTLPDDILTIMGDELDSANWDVSDPWVQATLKDTIVERIEEL